MDKLDKEDFKKMLELIDLNADLAITRERLDNVCKDFKDLYQYSHEYMHDFKDKLNNFGTKIEVILVQLQQIKERQSKRFWHTNPFIIPVLSTALAFLVVELMKHIGKITIN